MKQDFKKDLEKREKTKSAVKNELHKFHAERLLNIHIRYIFSAEEKFHFWKRLGPILRIWEEEERKKKKEKNALFFINMNPFVNYSARRAVQKWTGWDRNTVRHSSLNEKWVEILSEVQVNNVQKVSYINHFNI